MILRRLVDYADRIEMPPEMYEMANVAWVIDLTEDGELEGFVGLDKVTMAVPRFRKESEPRVLSDQVRIMLGLEGGEKKHPAFVELTRQCAEETGDERVYAVVRFLEHFDRTEVPEDVDGKTRAVFRLSGEILTDLESVQRFWSHYSVRDDAVAGVCLVTGEDGMVETVLPGKIKRLQGASRTGAALVSAKHASTHHYGLDGSLNTPISRGAAEKYTAALNALLQDEHRHVFTGDYKTGKGITYVFWSQRPASGGEFFANLIADPKPEHVHDLIRAPKSGAGIPPALETDAFYTLALSGNAGRVQIRDYTETTVADLKENVTRWFEAQEISDAWGQPADPLKIFSHVASCYADTKEVQPRSVAALWKTALHGTRPPTDLLTCAVRRNRVEGDRGNVTRSRAALIKLLFAYTQEGGETMEQTPAYNCGRLLAELQAVQEAVRGRGNTNVERQYGTASTSPASMFGLLIRNSQAHMATIRRDKPHIAPILEARMEEIMSHFEDGFPNTLPLKEQAVFSIGYYQHRAAIRAEIKARAEARRDGQHTEEVS